MLLMIDWSPCSFVITIAIMGKSTLSTGPCFNSFFYSLPEGIQNTRGHLESTSQWGQRYPTAAAWNSKMSLLPRRRAHSTRYIPTFVFGDSAVIGLDIYIYDRYTLCMNTIVLDFVGYINIK